MSDLNSVKREIEAEARRLFPGAVRRVEWLGYGDAPVIEPGEILPQFVLAEPAGLHGTNVKRMIKGFQEAHTPALKQFRLDAAELEAADRLIATGVAASRAEALRWALGRVREAGPGALSLGTGGLLYSLPRFLEFRMIWVTR